MTFRPVLFLLFAAIPQFASAQWSGSTQSALEAENARREAAANAAASSSYTAPADMPVPAVDENLADKQAAEARKARVEANRPVLTYGGGRRGNTYIVNGSGLGAAAAGAAMVGTDALMGSGSNGAQAPATAAPIGTNR